MIGTTLSHYKILERLGAGAMGVVYRARDENLERDVALKILPDGACDAPSQQRFRREALALSRLNHPHIAIVHDFGRVDGTDFMVMELVQGDSLAARIAQGPLAEGDLIVLGTQIADALEAAHERGVIHRDLKPENVWITTRGQIKVLDFGVATLLETDGETVMTRTRAGGGPAPGTLLYMAPEQLLGGAADTRSDLYALGVVLYEMATGRRPFDAATPNALMYQVLNATPASPSRLRADLSPRLEEVILRALERDPTRRYQSAKELHDDLRRAGETGATGAVPAARARRIDSLAVLPLENLSGDPEQEFFADGMTDALIAGLAQIEGLRVISRTSAMRYKGAGKPLPEIARELNVEAVVEGSVVQAGNRVRITAQLIEAATDRHLWAKSYQRDLADVLALQGEVAAAIAAEIRGRLAPALEARLRASRPVHPLAFEATLRGRQHWNRRTEADVRKGIEFFKRAIEIDPGHALAYSGLADSYNILGDQHALAPGVAAASANEATRLALELDPDLAEAHTSLGFIRTFFEWDWPGAEQAYQRALALKPSYATGRQWYAEYLISQGRLEEAVAEARRAVELDPLAIVLRTSLADALYFSRRYDEALTELRHAIELEPEFHAAYTDLVRIYTQVGRYDDAERAFETASRLRGGVKAAPAMAYVHALAGRHDEARRILELQIAARAERHVSPHAIAVIHIGLGDREGALEWLETAYRERDRALVWIKVHPRLDPLRGEPRFQALLQLMKLG